MRLLARLVAVAGLVVAGGLALPGGAAQAAACSGTSGVTVVIDYGSSSSTRCAPDTSKAITALTSVASVTYPPQYQGTVVCQINSVPSQACTRMPPQNAYWAFFHATRGGSWTYSSSGVADYDPAPGTVIGFAFGSGGAPSTAPPAATVPKPSPKPSPSSTSSSRPPAPKPKPKPSATPPATPRGSVNVPPHGATTTLPGATAGSATTAPTGATASSTTPTTSSTGSTTAVAPSEDATAGSGATTAAASSAADGSGSPTTLLAGLGLVGLVGAGAAYLAVRRRAHP